VAVTQRDGVAMTVRWDRPAEEYVVPDRVSYCCFCDITAMSANRVGPVSYQKIQKKKNAGVGALRSCMLYLHCFIN
jgi:hypothetical protein